MIENEQQMLDTPPLDVLASPDDTENTFSEEVDNEQSVQEDAAEDDDDEQEGETSGEQPSASTGKYHARIERDAHTAVVGDNAHVTINKFLYILGGKQLADESDEDVQDLHLYQLIRANLKQAGQSATLLTVQQESNPAAPDTDEKFSAWYYQLTLYEQCFVLAASVFHGSSAHEVSKRAEKLYKRLNRQGEQDTAEIASQTIEQTVNLQAEDVLSIQYKPRHALYTATLTKTERVDGVERLFWQDVDAHGVSTFGLHLLVFLVKEFVSKGERGQRFLDLLKEWSKEARSEDAWRVAHAYGVVLWHQNIHQLRYEAHERANVSSLSDSSRMRTASFLDGAYEIEYVTCSKAVAENEQTSTVLQLLRSWVDGIALRSGESGRKMSRGRINMACAAASTYGLLGKRSPMVALYGIEHLFQQLQDESLDWVSDVFAAATATYVTLTWAGHIRPILYHLAACADVLVHQRQQPAKNNRSKQYYQQRSLRFNATSGAFFLIAATSFSGTQHGLRASYSPTDPLPEQIAIPDPHGHDILLKGVLLPEEQAWREQIMILLCAAIIEKKSRPAFDLLQQWATLLSPIQEPQLHNAFIQFLVDLGKKLEIWCSDIHQHGFYMPYAAQVYKKYLATCASRQYRPHPLKMFAAQALQHLTQHVS